MLWSFIFVITSHYFDKEKGMQGYRRYAKLFPL